VQVEDERLIRSLYGLGDMGLRYNPSRDEENFR
jgi:hypothetical protein